MLRTAIALALTASCLTTACGGDTAGTDTTDTATATDATATDATATDATATDATATDATATDATATDATATDATTTDATTTDATTTDATTTDVDVDAADAVGDVDATGETDGQVCPAIDHCAEVACSGASATCARCDDGFDADGAGGCKDHDDCDPNPCGAGVCTDIGTNAHRCTASAVVDAATGGTAAIETPAGEVSVALEPNALVDELGAPFDGEAHLTVALGGFDGSYLADDGQAFSPDIAAELTLTDAGGAVLEVAAGKAVVITLPLPADAGYSEAEPVEISYYDVGAEVWVPAATGTVIALDGALAARASVTHFTWFGVGRRCPVIAHCQRVACGNQTCAQCADGFAKNASGGCDNIDDCATHPCGPGTCVNGIASFTCICPAAYDGPRCEHDVDGCLQAPRAAGVTCTDVPAPGTGRTCGPCPDAMKDDHDACTLDTCDGATAS